MAPSTTTAPAGHSPDKGPARRRGALLHRLDLKAAPYAFVAPFFVVFAAFSFYPLLYTSWISLHDVELATLDVMQWVAFDNYVELWAIPGSGTHSRTRSPSVSSPRCHNC